MPIGGDIGYLVAPPIDCVPGPCLVVNYQKTFVEGDSVLDLQVKLVAVPAFFLCQPLYS